MQIHFRVSFFTLILCLIWINKILLHALYKGDLACVNILFKEGQNEVCHMYNFGSLIFEKPPLYQIAEYSRDLGAWGFVLSYSFRMCPLRVKLNFNSCQGLQQWHCPEMGFTIPASECLLEGHMVEAWRHFSPLSCLKHVSSAICPAEFQDVPQVSVCLLMQTNRKILLTFEYS